MPSRCLDTDLQDALATRCQDWDNASLAALFWKSNKDDGLTLRDPAVLQYISDSQYQQIYDCLQTMRPGFTLLTTDGYRRLTKLNLQAIPCVMPHVVRWLMPAPGNTANKILVAGEVKTPWT